MNEGWKSSSQEVLEALIAKYASRRDEIELDIKIALKDPRSIPDHFRFVEDLSALVEEAERFDSLVNYTKTLIGRLSS